MDTGDPETSALSGALRAHMREQRAKPAYLARVGGLAPNTIVLILRGTTGRPKPETLRRLALALATDPYTGEVDRPYLERALGDLQTAAGYIAVGADVRRAVLRLGLRLAVAGSERVAAWEWLIERYASLPGSSVRTLSPRRGRAPAAHDDGD